MSKKISYIIFGASGDLAKRYLLPALRNIDVEVILISRQDYGNFKDIIKNEGEKIFHLAIPAKAVPEAVKLIADNFGKKDVKILLEKPFGENLALARDLIIHIDQFFDEEQIYRIDHYLAKKSLQRIVGQIGNDFKNVEIIASEKIDIEGRVNFYEQTGALRDFVQSHLLEMAAIVLCQSNKPQKRYEALKNLAVVCDITQHECVKRGQYEGYKAEVGNPLSLTETFVSINLIMNDIGVNLKTGKAMSEKLTQIKIKYKDNTEKIFDIDHETDAYERVITAAIAGNKDLFISSEETLESWRILDVIQETWGKSATDLVIYKKGSTIEEVLNQ